MQNSKCGWIGSSIGQKQLVGITGLGLCGFVLTHMLGNLLILVGPQAYNEYSNKLITNPLIEVAEVGLVALILVHLGLATRLSIKNWRARDSRYAVKATGDKATSYVQRLLWGQGVVILVFVILHLITFKYGAHYKVNYGQGEMRDLHRLVMEVFSQPGYVIWYFLALLVLGMHLSHGFGSVFQTFGLHHPRYQKSIKCLSFLYAVSVAGGFIIQPIYVYLIHRG